MILVGTVVLPGAAPGGRPPGGASLLEGTGTGTDDELPEMPSGTSGASGAGGSALEPPEELPDPDATKISAPTAPRPSRMSSPELSESFMGASTLRVAFFHKCEYTFKYAQT